MIYPRKAELVGRNWVFSVENISSLPALNFRIKVVAIESPVYQLGYYAKGVGDTEIQPYLISIYTLPYWVVFSIPFKLSWDTPGKLFRQKSFWALKVQAIGRIEFSRVNSWVYYREFLTRLWFYIWFNLKEGI